MIIVTGGAGFIGSNIVRHLNERDIEDIVVVDDMTDGRKMFNLAGCEIADYLDKDAFLDALARGMNPVPGARAILHQGACTTTTEWDGRFMMAVNFEYSKRLLDYCTDLKLPLIYASSASVYGAGTDFRVERVAEKPINVYAYSKFMFDQYVRRHGSSINSQVVGLRYFNVYGPGEAHKGGMASVIWHFHNQLQNGDAVRLFEGSDGYGPGEQRRDFIHVDDVAAVNLWCLDNPGLSGIFNLGTGRAQSFNDVANAVIAWHGRGRVEYIPFPESLHGSYQSFTEADMGALRDAGYSASFMSIEQGVPRYLDALSPAAAD